MKYINQIQNQALWFTLKEYAIKAGRTTARPLLYLFYVLTSQQVAPNDRTIILAAISYLLLPINLLSVKKLSLIGLIDEAISIYTVYEKIKKYITPEIEWKVNTQLDKWFPEYEIVTE